MKINKKTRLLGVVASVTLLGAALAGCSTQPSATSQAPTTPTAPATTGAQPVYGGTLNLDLAGAFPHLDPVKAYDTTSYEAVLQFYNQLVTYQGATNKIIPSLASRYTISPNGKVYTFYLANAKFWNGHPVTAQSFITEFERVLNPVNSSGGQGFIDPIIAGSNAYYSGHAKTISGLKSLNGGKTLQITLMQRDPVFLYVLAMPFFSAVDPSYIAGHSESYIDHNPMGTGPFYLASYQPNQQWVFKKNPHYFQKGIPYLNEIVFTNNSSPSAELLHYKQGLTGLLGYNIGGNGIPSQDYLPIVMSPTYSKQVYKVVQVATQYIGLNNKVGPTANVKVRRALEYAINKNYLVKVLGGRALPANQIIPPSMPSGYEAKLPANATYSYNPALAKKLLAQAGYPHGFTTTIYCDNSNPDDLRITEAVQSMLKAVGVTANINQSSWGTFLTNNETGNQPMFNLAWVEDFPDPSDFLNTLFNSNQRPVNNSTMYSNPAVDKLLNTAANMPAGTARDNLYKQAQNIIMSQAAWIPYAYPVFTAAVQPWLKGYYLNPNQVDPLQYVWIAKH
ncbi:ABC transporter substrate-binding protein [Ferroacidibacillus organovorans]|uniref:Solute-binding protein family 5 domain-containing protein n=1 Tax=Ferroacidibacillus organovorans TaxID=1765683 RepID=A0A1V4EXG3_9BACL|nr:ABC transporter substrate-binding protein [Ferroacidibacillus organovorans]OPG17623.1 hypothetical protein B2M26_00240 [Ferroacidibacillus organovorans]